ncbi:P-loop NTPase fold protein [Frigoribacterium sp. PhB118]|uniref:P-loop NTPase fold protein n=1 Tax=Frigoribacterium sp. PhB118 TaxID=2485175 RepID=UPI000F48F6CE|nr:P-loop NTPase fold protein [Frigoribacterium sp. PhB118]ROS56566.1 KAP-like P-loop domain-containing protein [Frigoribacterium sp. PhB118]
MSTSDATANAARLTASDLVPDEPLRGSGKNPIADSQDLLHHRVIARKVAELATSANGKANIALFGPWGAGKSSFNELLGEELKSGPSKALHITFDAWKNAGDGFRTNFLSELARQIPNADRTVSDQLFQATTQVSFPFIKGVRGGKGPALIAAAILVFLFLLLPLAWTALGAMNEPSPNFVNAWLRNVGAWSGFAVSSSLLLAVSATLVELSKVTVSKSTPSHVAQFSVLFNKLLSTDPKRRYVIFIDELDRCGKKDVMATLEGLRTFLGHDRCVFVVAFDRAAIATTIAEEMEHAAPSQSISPYYRTSGEYLDKIFQFQLALPPQPPHTFRRYALSLVRDRGGVWAQLKEYQDGLLDRVVAVLSPMHLASPRRTKVLLNDFAVNARLFESLGFDWLHRAEEIAVLTVLQTEFPKLMADIERAPSLMRFLYREEEPTRPEIKELLDQYHGADTREPSDVELDQVVKSRDSSGVARDLQRNLSRYLRRLREMGAPEPRVDLILMHSDGNLLHFEDPDVYNEVLLAADLPRKDVVEALSLASVGDRALAIDHILEQAEPESSQIALSLRVLAGELATELPSISISTASNLQAGMSGGLKGHSQTSLEGYARAVAVSYSDDSSTQLLDAAAKLSDAAVEAVVSRFVEDLTPEDWRSIEPAVLGQSLGRAARLPAAVAAVLRRQGNRPSSALNDDEVNELAAGLSIAEPVTVEAAVATAAARQEAEAQNALLSERFEEEREQVRAATETVLGVWPQLPPESGARRSVLNALRRAHDGTSWHLDVHDRLIRETIEAGYAEAANAHLLTAIAALPHLAAGRWRNLLSSTSWVEAGLKAEALDAVVDRATSNKDVATRSNGAHNAFRLASLPSDPVSGETLLIKVMGAIEPGWDEYTDDRFEYLARLLDALDLLRDPLTQTTEARVRLFVDAVTSAQEEDASVEQIFNAAEALDPTEAAHVADGLFQAQLWTEDYSHRSLRVLLAAQERALAAGIKSQSPPANAIRALDGTAHRKQIADAWLGTTPTTAEYRVLLQATTFSAAAWTTFGERVTSDRRAEAWQLLIGVGATAETLRALSRRGQPLHVYEKAAADVRDAGSRSTREAALDRLLALPVDGDAGGVAQALVKGMALEGKRTEMPLGVRLIKAYDPVWSRSTVSTLRPQFTDWAEAAESYIPQRDKSWLARSGYIAKKSSIRKQIFGPRK